MGILKDWLARKYSGVSAPVVCSPSAFDVVRIIGRRPAEAKAIILAAGLRFRVVAENGHRFVMPADNRADRVLLEVEANVVTDATIR